MRADSDVVSASAARYAVRYDPSSPQLVRARLVKLQIDYRRFTFIGFGSGKGRVLMVSVRRADWDRLLARATEVAVKSIARFPRCETRASAVRSICGDAGAYEPPSAISIILSDRRS
jgi:hypothetical protein